MKGLLRGIKIHLICRVMVDKSRRASILDKIGYWLESNEANRKGEIRRKKRGGARRAPPR
ncbi:MAG: hypothetical protein ACYCYP_06430 [Leptospirales bacterium]